MLEESIRILEDLGEKYFYVYALLLLGYNEAQFGDYTAARIHLEQGLAIATEIKHPGGVADAHTNLGDLFRIQGEYLTAQSHLEAAYQLYHEHGSGVWETGVLCYLAQNEIAQGDLSAARLHILAASSHPKLSENKLANEHVRYSRGLLASYEGDIDEASALLGEALALIRKEAYQPDVGGRLIALARVMRMRGDIVQATESILEALDLFNKYGRKLGIAIALEELAAVQTVQSDAARAVMLLSVAHTLRERLGAPLPPVDRAAYESTVTVCRAQLGETAFKALWASASARPFEEVVEGILRNKDVHGTYATDVS
jgi:tetratricopeptide (TPR) repeat protein